MALATESSYTNFRLGAARMPSVRTNLVCMNPLAFFKPLKLSNLSWSSPITEKKTSATEWSRFNFTWLRVTNPTRGSFT